MNPKQGVTPVSHGFPRGYISSIQPDLANTPPSAQEKPPNDQEALKFASSEIEALKRVYRYDLKSWMTKARWEGLFRNQQLKLLKASESQSSIHSWLSNLDHSGRFKSVHQDKIPDIKTTAPVPPIPAPPLRGKSKTSSEIPSIIGRGETAPDLTKPVNKVPEGAGEIELRFLGAPKAITSPPLPHFSHYLNKSIEALISNELVQSEDRLISVTQNLSNFDKSQSKVEHDFSPTEQPEGKFPKPLEPKPTGVNKPQSKETVVTQYSREATVKSWVLNEAQGICECCRKKAPFKTAEGLPYLEVHHVLEISNGGSDTTSNSVAICPNCHRELHFGASREILKEKLYKTVSRLVREL